MSGSRARWAVVAVLLALVLGPAAAADETSPSSPTAAAWHPTGVGQLTAPTYAEGTLHVGAALGQETDRTYLRFELGSVPDGADVEGVTVTVPVDPDAGTSAPETAVILGCAVPDGFDPEAAEPATAACEGAPEATFAAGDAPTFTLALPAPADGAALDVALVPGGGDSWHVGFTTATAVVAYDLPTTATPATTTPARPPAQPSFLPPTGREPVALPPMTVAPPAASGGAIADEAAASTPAAVTSVPTGGSAGFRYAAVFALPLALLVVGAVLGDGLTRPVRLREDAT